MKKLIAITILTMAAYSLYAQSCAKTCEKKSCGPEGTKKEEAAVISGMRNDLQLVITKISRSSLNFDSQLREMKIEKGANDDESILFISQAAASIRYEILNKVEPSNLVASLKDFRPASPSSKREMVANLKKEIQVLAAQAEKL